jgi:hypothetical protein
MNYFVVRLFVFEIFLFSWLEKYWQVENLQLPVHFVGSPVKSGATVSIFSSEFQVGWVKADTKAIQAIHDHVITHNPRVSVTHLDVNTWNLHIKSVAEEDRGGWGRKFMFELKNALVVCDPTAPKA